jgi:hypothetical protein
MKTINTLMATAVVVASFVACETADTEGRKNSDMYVVYVDSIQNLTPEYTNESWSNIEKGYQKRVVIVDRDMDKFDDETKAKLEESRAKYNALKASYENIIRERKQQMVATTNVYKTNLRNALFGEGSIGTDVAFNYVTSSNLHSVYEKFVNTVQDNKRPVRLDRSFNFLLNFL